MHSIVFKSKSNKSPGPDGFSNEFFKVFWPEIGTVLLKLMNSYWETGCIDKHQNMGIITCIPKRGKLRNELRNWRPITLLNSIYKFYSSILAERIKIVLPKLIHTDQKGFINGRFIGENTRLIYDIIHECSQQNSKGLIVLIDFEKAFDSISWTFIRKSINSVNQHSNGCNLYKKFPIQKSYKMVTYQNKFFWEGDAGKVTQSHLTCSFWLPNSFRKPPGLIQK